MVRRFRKEGGLKFWQPLEKLEGHIFSFGRVGSGKSVSLMSIIQGYRDLYNYKIWDLYGGDRNEGLFWALPKLDNNFEKKLLKLGQLDEPMGKQYPVNFLYPYFESKLPKRLPFKPPYVKSTLFTIPINDIDYNDVKMVLGNMSDTIKGLFNDLLEEVSKKDNIVHIAENTTKKKNLLYTNFIKPMAKEKFLMDKYCDYNLNFEEEAKQKEVISVLCLDFVPERFHLFVLNYLLRKIKTFVEKTAYKFKFNLCFIREAATFFRVMDDIVVEDRLKVFRGLLSHYIRMGRSGMYFALDCQSSFETKSLVQGSEDYLFIFKTTSSRDKEELCTELKREKRMRADQVADLANLKKGQAYIVEIGKNVSKHQITEPRTMYWRKEYPNFYTSLWERLGGGWQNTNEIKDYINERCFIPEAKPKTKPEMVVKPKPQEIKTPEPPKSKRDSYLTVDEILARTE